MNTWNYRVVRTERRRPGGGEDFSYEVHEVYYDRNGTPTSATQDPVGPYGETLEELSRDLAQIQRALELPVLEWVSRGDGERFLRQCKVQPE